MSASSSQSKTIPQITLRPLALRNRKVREVAGLLSAPTPAQPLTAGKDLKQQCASTRLAPLSGMRKPKKHNSWLQSARSARFGRELIGKLVGASPNGASCVHNFGTVQCLQVARFARRALLANQSLNRTFCGRPLQAVISLSALCNLPQNAG